MDLDILENKMRSKQYVDLIDKWVAKTHLSEIIKDDFIFIPNHKARILDVGCGECYLYDSLIKNDELLKGKLFYEGIDLRENEFIHSENEIKFINDSIINLNDQYEYIVSCHMLEHVNNDIEILQKINSLLKPNGKFFIAVPEIRSYIAERLDVGHINLYTLNHLIQKLVECDFVPFNSMILEIIKNKKEIFIASYKR